MCYRYEAIGFPASAVGFRPNQLEQIAQLADS
jgi:hypothetical protein